MTKLRLFIIAALAFAGTALAHTGVKNEAVKARMNGMSAIGNEMKILGDMAKGATQFDPALARAAAAAIADHAAATPDLFEAAEDDPHSEAKEVIWSDFEAFTAISARLNKTALDLSDTLETEDDLRTGLQVLGNACKDCHSVYRE